jgi:hypothetical protein
VRVPKARSRVRGVLATLSAVALTGCGSSPITSAKIEASIAPTFANLVHLQVSWLGLPPMAASDFAVQASCRKLTGSNAGSGEWACTLVWKGPERQGLRDTYDLFVATDGCYMATVASESLGGPMLKTLDGKDVRNLLYAFEGCFDTT